MRCGIAASDALCQAATGPQGGPSFPNGHSRRWGPQASGQLEFQCGNASFKEAVRREACRSGGAHTLLLQALVSPQAGPQAGHNPSALPGVPDLTPGNLQTGAFKTPLDERVPFRGPQGAGQQVWLWLRTPWAFCNRLLVGGWGPAWVKAAGELAGRWSEPEGAAVGCFPLAPGPAHGTAVLNAPRLLRLGGSGT